MEQAAAEKARREREAVERELRRPACSRCSALFTAGRWQECERARVRSATRTWEVTAWAGSMPAAGARWTARGELLDVAVTIQVGHIFKLGRKYTEKLGVFVLGADDDRVVPTMGSYGIGVERAMASIVESHHDDKGLSASGLTDSSVEDRQTR